MASFWEFGVTERLLKGETVMSGETSKAANADYTAVFLSQFFQTSKAAPMYLGKNLPGRNVGKALQPLFWKTSMIKGLKGLSTDVHCTEN